MPQLNRGNSVTYGGGLVEFIDPRGVEGFWSIFTGKGCIHRDVKAGNILVDSHGARDLGYGRRAWIMTSKQIYGPSASQP
ncbi:hypothetical protein IFM89_037125 [Coptis chinensis]|uniref:Protein kinase domain-containing protein n=1 Tax=Coptis chinensis TaxID=261450 RepID=A0A835LWI3_9MAGN|nr:hypothetical protein IFM89_037125 [Coptis chinensis]